MLTKLCCMRLNTAGIVLGWLGIVGSFIMTIACSVILGYSDVIANRIVTDRGVMQTYEEVHMAIIIVASIYLAIVVMNLMASGLLVLGTMKERHLMLLPWLINSSIGLIFSSIYQLFFFIAALGSGQFGSFIFPLIFSSCILGLQIYIYCGIFALFKQIQLAREQQLPLINPPQTVSVPPNQGTSYANYTKM